MFLHNSYYHFRYLAEALRRRGWDAISVDMHTPDERNTPLFHGEDLNLYDPNPQKFRANIDAMFDEVKRRFQIVHFAGMGMMSFYPENFDSDPLRTKIPTDFIELRKAGKRISYTISGCLDGISQTSFRRWSEGCCEKCAWRNRQDICSDLRNLTWGAKLQMFTDLVCGENNPALDYCATEKTCRGPVTMALSNEVWNEHLDIPEKYVLSRKPDELIVYHSFANFDIRTEDGADIKGTHAIMSAVERLRSDGVNVRLEFITNVPSRDVRFIMAQADVVVEQLNAGRSGATGREAMMLGKPVVVNFKSDEEDSERDLQCWQDFPGQNATEETVYTVLRDLLSNPDKRRQLSAASRTYAMKWFEADACAARYEEIWDRMSADEKPVVIERGMFGVGE